MKRDKRGKFIQSWGLEAKQAVNLSLTKTAWQLLQQEAHKRGISRSELVERFARSLELDTADNYVAKSNDTVAALLNLHNSDVYDGLCLHTADAILNVVQVDNTEISSTYTANGQQAEDWFRQVLDVIPHIVWTCKPNGELEYFNQQPLIPLVSTCNNS